MNIHFDLLYFDWRPTIYLKLHSYLGKAELAFSLHGNLFINKFY